MPQLAQATMTSSERELLRGKSSLVAILAQARMTLPTRVFVKKTIKVGIILAQMRIF